MGATRRTLLGFAGGAMALATALAGISADARAQAPARPTGEQAIAMLPEAVRDAARREGRLTIYITQARGVVDPTVAAFRRAFPGVQVSILRLATGPLYTRFTQETNAGVFQADVTNFAGTQLFTDHPDWFTPLTAELVPTLAQWPRNQVHGNYLNSAQGPQLLAYNRNLVTGSNIPRTWEDVLNPFFRGKGMLVDPRSSNTYMNWLNLMFETYGESFVTRLRDQRFTLVEGGSQGAQQVAAGAALIVLPPSFAHVEPLLERGAPLVHVYASENSNIPSIGPQHSWAIPRRAPNPNAARVFMTWFLTEDAQKINCGGNSASVLLTNFDGCPKPTARFISADGRLPRERVEMLTRLMGLQ
ncbi:MAG: extracellular solute-binding protein [Alphaproteobacteria bacterium]|nr:extracellular solute-binding protein [Alphaproteobacteria bacterium]